MSSYDKRCGTGLPSLDEVVDHLRLGDNVVWQVDSLDAFRPFVLAFVRQALADGRTVRYLRFASHPPLVGEAEIAAGVRVVSLDAGMGFESFTTAIHALIHEEGLEVFYVFDCLTDLLESWASDLMIGNFFRITCPALFRLDTIAYFALLRRMHAFETIARIRDTTQLLLDLHEVDRSLYLHPLKVWERYSPTMFLPHRWKDGALLPLSDSVEAARLFTHLSPWRPDAAAQRLDAWDRLFQEAVTAHGALPSDHPERRRLAGRLLDLLVGREDRIRSLCDRYFQLPDLLSILGREIGTGRIGGKAVGMLLGRRIVGSALPDEDMESHDSFFIGADVFYTYLVHNGCWDLRMRQKAPDGYFRLAGDLKERILSGSFPEAVRERFRLMLEHYGQSPIIVRSSSLLEDDFGNAFAGKYESVFCVNQGSPARRLEQFEQAVRTVYGSMMDEDALTYRLRRGLSGRDEQMALLVQRVSGRRRTRWFFPDLAGVAQSRNLYVWDPRLVPEAGMVRLVLGLGTRSVDRVEGDYPAMVALDNPTLRTASVSEDPRRYSQHFVDAMDLEENRFVTLPLEEVAAILDGDELDLLATRDRDAEVRRAELRLPPVPQWMLTFRKLRAESDFASRIQAWLGALEAAYEYPVDVEFTANRSAAGRYVLNLLQCRPLQTRGMGAAVRMPAVGGNDRLLLATQGPFMGGNARIPLRRIIEVDPAAYCRIGNPERHAVARAIGRLNAGIPDRESFPVLLLGPGRWGTTTPSLGVPVRFSEIHNVAVLGEVAFENAGMMPELSFGSHFFQDLVESGIFYLAVFPGREGVMFDPARWSSLGRDRFPDLLPEAAALAGVIRVFDLSPDVAVLYSDVLSQTLACQLEPGPDEPDRAEVGTA